MPSPLTGIGVAWLMASTMRDRSGGEAYRPAPAARWDSPEHIDAHIGQAEGAVIRAPDEYEPPSQTA